MRKIIMCMVGILLFSQLIYGLSDRYLIEDNLTTIAQESLDAMFGKDNFIVRVQVQMTDSKYSVRYTKESTPKRSKASANKAGEQVYILPGVPALKNIAPDSLKQLPYDSVTTMVAPKIKKMFVKVLVNKSYPRSQARKAEGVLKDVLDMKDKRGDKIKMDFKSFYQDPNQKSQNITIIPGPEKILSVDNLFNVLIILLFIVFIFIYSRYQKQLLAKDDSADSGGPSINVSPSLELPEGLGGNNGSDMNINMGSDVKRYFDFVTQNNISDFIFLIKSQNLKPDYISLIVSFLSPSLAAKILNELEPKIQAQVTVLLADQRLGSKDLLDKLEKKLKADVECFVGGQNKVADLAQSLSNRQRKHITEFSKKLNPKSYKKLRPHMILFEDIMLLDDSELQFVLSDLNLEQLATALVGVDQGLFAKIVDNLTKGASDMVNQYLELKSESSTESQIEKSQDGIIKVLKKLDGQGKIKLSEKLKAA
ncbi:hypothetical protein DID74_02245 [Candidatus Marinamargulisbacteria bacterium SCGC AG-333-B06]|nr:hypothetical protein DID74_02245 [Candidatus Marinamargulisbacteria bacterium SCGC AG-333-B06]